MYRHCNDAIVNIDLKTVPTVLKDRLGLTEEQVLDIYQQKIQKVYDLIVQYNMQNRVYWVSFSEVFQEKIRQDEQFGQISRCFSGRQAIRVLALWFFGLLPFCSLKDQHWNMLLITDERARLASRKAAETGRNGCTRRLVFWLLKALL